MRNIAQNIKRLSLVTAFAAAALLGGCAGVEFEGPAFEKLGLTGKKNVAEKKVPDRAPLLIPPDRTRLPEPAPQVANARPENWPTDPDSILKAEASEAAKKQQEYQDKGDWSKKADIDEFEKLSDPGRRSPGVFGNKPLSDKYRDQTKSEN